MATRMGEQDTVGLGLFAMKRAGCASETQRVVEGGVSPSNCLSTRSLDTVLGGTRGQQDRYRKYPELN